MILDILAVGFILFIIIVFSVAQPEVAITLAIAALLSISIMRILDIRLRSKK